ncbi:MAG: YdbC family protein [Candidatus Dormibacteraeota bacterium]|nr:YdbC family protein [Candidatus Dormibacteraeota bacterium]
MAILVTVKLPNQTAADAETWRERNKTLPQQPGFIFQGDGPTEGGWQITSAWESRETFESFMSSQVRPNLKPGEEDQGDMQVSELAGVTTR